MITCENPNNAKSEITQIVSSTVINKDRSTDQIDSGNTNAVKLQTKNSDQSQITGMYTGLVPKSGYKHI